MSALATATRRLGPRAARGFASTSASSTSVSSSDASIAWTVGDYARTGVAAGIAIATAGVCEAAINDLYVWSLCKRKAMPAIETHARLQRSLGEPMRADAWWNASVTHRGKGNLASCVFLLDGARASCDVQVVMARAPSRSEGMYAFAAYVPNLLKNVFDPGAWRVVRMEAILPHEREAGLPGRVNLLQEPEPKGGILETQGGQKGGKGGKGGGWGTRIGRWFRRRGSGE